MFDHQQTVAHQNPMFCEPKDGTAARSQVVAPNIFIHRGIGSIQAMETDRRQLLTDNSVCGKTQKKKHFFGEKKVWSFQESLHLFIFELALGDASLVSKYPEPRLFEFSREVDLFWLLKLFGII